MTRILVVDDDPRLLSVMSINLTARGHHVETVATGRAALASVRVAVPDLVVLDLGLPDIDGTDVIRELRAWTEVPIVVLSGRTGARDKVVALDAGADDYVTKPFGVEELLARIRAITRRAGAGDGGEPHVVFGDVTVDLGARTCTKGGEAVRLTPTEWHLLEAFCRQPGKLLSQRSLLGQVWGSAYLNQPATLRLYMTQLRRKLEPEPERPRYLLTEPGMGYRFSPTA